MAKKNPPLTLFSEIEYEEKASKGYPASCPTLDLSATWDAAGKNLFIYRPPSQAVSKIHQVAAPGKKAPDAQAVTWKPDGTYASHSLPLEFSSFASI
jgi:anaphase-promoting complex subunit 4